MQAIFKCLMVISAIAFMPGHLSYADSFGKMEEICGDNLSATVSEDVFVEGIVISDWRNPNMEVNPNINQYTVNTVNNDITAYIQTLDGKRGLRIIMEDRHYNRLCRYDIVTLNLKGAVLSRQNDVRAWTVSGVTPANVVSYRHGSVSDLAVKKKRISELTDDDVYTWVTLEDTEFIFKDGTYADIMESYGLPVKKYHSGYKAIHSRMDGWLTSLRDSDGNGIYMMVNSLCDWRRDGDGVPAGSGTVSGILVSSNLRRFGDYAGRYCIRPFDKESFDMAGQKSNWKSLGGFYFDGSMGNMLFFENAGEVHDINKGKFTGDRILSDKGVKSYLWTDTGARIRLVADYNNLTADASANAKVNDGAVDFSTPSNSWYVFDESGKVIDFKGIYIEIPTGKVKKAEKLHLSFDIAAGNGSMASCQHYPYEWKVEVSSDCREWVRLKDNITGRDSFALRTIPAWTKTVGNVKYPTQYDCGFGFQQHNFDLPLDLAGAGIMYVKISPASTVLAAIHPKSDKSSAVKSDKSNVARKTNTEMTHVRFGTIRIDYK